MGGKVIREATLQDVPALVEMGQLFLTSTAYESLVGNNPDQMRVTAEYLISGDAGTVLVAENATGALVAMIGLQLFPHHISGQRTVGEAFLWVDPQSRGTLGVRLLKAAYAWAQTMGAEKMQLVAPIESGVGAIYEHLGYTAIEVAYQKDVAA